jgi:hypothetical protein
VYRRFVWTISLVFGGVNMYPSAESILSKAISFVLVDTN